jgi:hypothetical protein
MNGEDDLISFFDNERVILAFEKIASALGGLHNEVSKAGKRYWPEPGQQKEAILSRVPTEEDRIKERQGSGDDRPIKEWLSELGDPEGDAGIVGERSRQWIIDHPETSPKAKIVNASPKVASVGEQDVASIETAEGKI